MKGLVGMVGNILWLVRLFELVRLYGALGL